MIHRNNIIIELNNISKAYRLGEEERYLTLRDSIINGFNKLCFKTKKSQSRDKKDNLFFALKDINFKIEKGETIGIIGKNGAGKSTLLKILSRITRPTEGNIILRGRLASLLEVGTGFHPELTGRENIYLNGVILGMKKKEIKKKFDEIVDFSGVEKFIDTPVKRYSSGMYVRLAFAVAAYLESEILIVDEVLAVGDASFQKKCLGKMSGIAQEGRTVLFVSHNLSAVKLMCSRALYLEKGMLDYEGKTEEVIKYYIEKIKDEIDSSKPTISYVPDYRKTGQITYLAIFDMARKNKLKFNIDEDIFIQFDVELRNDFLNLFFEIKIFDAEGNLVLSTVDSDLKIFQGAQKNDIFPYEKGKYSFCSRIPSPLLNVGIYEIEIIITPGPVRVDSKRNVFIEIHEEGSFLSFVTKSRRGGVLAVPLEWQMEKL